MWDFQPVLFTVGGLTEVFPGLLLYGTEAELRASTV